MSFGRPPPPSRWDALPGREFQDDYIPTRQPSTRRSRRESSIRADTNHGASSSNFENSLRRSNARSRTHTSTTRDWGPTNSNMDIRTSYGRDTTIGRSSTTAFRNPTRTTTTRTRSSTLRPDSTLYEPGVDLTNYNGGYLNNLTGRGSSPSTRAFSTIGESSNTVPRDTSYHFTTRRDSTCHSRYDSGGGHDLSTYGGDVYAHGHNTTRRSERPSDRSFASRVGSTTYATSSIYSGRQSKFREATDEW